MFKGRGCKGNKNREERPELIDKVKVVQEPLSCPVVQSRPVLKEAPYSLCLYLTPSCRVNHKHHITGAE